MNSTDSAQYEATLPFHHCPFIWEKLASFLVPSITHQSTTESKQHEKIKSLFLCHTRDLEQHRNAQEADKLYIDKVKGKSLSIFPSVPHITVNNWLSTDLQFFIFAFQPHFKIQSPSTFSQWENERRGPTPLFQNTAFVLYSQHQRKLPWLMRAFTNIKPRNLSRQIKGT